jgi:hypothetical protein
MDNVRTSKETHNVSLRFEIFTAVTTKNVVFWDVTPCGSCTKRRFGGTYSLHYQGNGVTSQKTAFYIPSPLRAQQVNAKTI